MYRSQSELRHYGRMEAEAAGQKRATKRGAARVQATLAEDDARKRTLDELQAAVTRCLRAGGTYEVCYRDRSAYLTCLAAGGRDAQCRPDTP